MTRFQHRPVEGSPFYTHVIFDASTGETIAWATSLRGAEIACRLRNEDESDVEPLCAERPDDDDYRAVVERDLRFTIELQERKVA